MLNQKELGEAPKTSGIYLFKDLNGKVLYVGKAKNLKERLSYYFSPNLIETKTRLVLKEAQDLYYIQTISESDALILEADFIKRLKPKYNILLKDDKFYLYLRITRINSLIEVPRVFFARKKLPDSSKYFGPFPEGGLIKRVLREVRKIINFADCSDTKFLRHRKSDRGCLYFDLNLCLAPCAIKMNHHEYLSKVKILKEFLQKGSENLEKFIRKQMEDYSLRLDFEKAQKEKIKLDTLEQIRSLHFSPEDYRENPNLFTDFYLKSLIELEELLIKNGIVKQFVPTHKPLRIEGYDVSNLSGTNPSASMVVFEGNQPLKSGYRRFKIKKVKGINDYQMIKEVVERRLSHKNWPLPDLILVDGGLGQLKILLETLKENGLTVPVLGLAKRLERVAINRKYVNLKPDSPLLNLLKAVRDESHRFAKKYHKLLRLRSVFKRI